MFTTERPTTRAIELPVACHSWCDEGAARALRPIDALLRAIGERHPLLAGCTASNDADELERVRAHWLADRAVSPVWTPLAIDRSALLARWRELDLAERALVRADALPKALSHAYLARIVETSRELAVLDAAFQPSIVAAARARFSTATPDEVAAADRLATDWLRAETSARRDLARHRSDDEGDADSLIRRMRAAIEHEKLGVRVIARPRVGALAATGDGVVVVAAGRLMSAADVERVVVHEVEGHVLPRERGRSLRVGLATLGSAGASEDEEGRALLVEERADRLDADRRRSLAARHVAARIASRGGVFVETMRALLLDCGVELDDALRIAFRVHRGAARQGVDVVGGLAREQIYLPAFVRVRRAIERGDTTLAALGSARLSIATRAHAGLDVRAPSV